MEQKRISKAVIGRLPRYYRYLDELRKEGVERISSKELSEKMQLTASQIRQDLNHFGGFGQQGYGYNVEFLYNEIGKILGLDKKHNMILIGVGNIGRAMAGFLVPDMSGFHLAGLFDTDPNLIGTETAGLTIRSMNTIPEFAAENQVDMAVLAVPSTAAVEVAELVVRSGIKTIWNFALIDLNLIMPKDVVVENVHIFDSLLRLSYSDNLHKTKA